MDKFLGFKTEEILTCLLLVIVGYFIAKMFSRTCANRVNGFSVGIQDKYPGAPCTPTIKECRASSEDKEYIYTCPSSGVCERVTRRCGPLIDNCQDTSTSTCEHNGHLCKNCIAPEGGINGYWDGGPGGRIGGWCKVPAPPPTPPPTPPPPPPVDEGCTYTGDKDIRPPNSLPLEDYYEKHQDDERIKCSGNVVDSCENAYFKHFGDKYEGYCLQTQGTTFEGRGDCPLDINGKPAAWLINNDDPTNVEYAKNACISNKSENGVNKGDFAWVTEKGGVGSCKSCGNSPTPAPTTNTNTIKKMD